MSSAAVSTTFQRIKLLELAVEERDAHIATLCTGLSSITTVLDTISGFSCFGAVERAAMQAVVASSKGLLAVVNEARRAHGDAMSEEVETPRQRSDVERLLSASIEIIQKDQVIDDLLAQVERLKAENALLTARLDVVALQRMRAADSRADLPALLRTQV